MKYGILILQDVLAIGLIPYKDFNMIVGPTFPMFCGIFLTIFKQEMIVTRILGIIMNAFIFVMIYKIMSKLNIKEYIKYIILIIYAIIAKPYFAMDYNFRCNTYNTYNIIFGN